MWAGVECTVNRVGDRYFDQMVRSGHDRRESDLDLVAALGVKALRYPVLWERTAPGDLADANWAWSDERLAKLRTLGIAPIIGLLHHGSGPAHTSLIDPAFPEKLAQYARAVAERYPWVRSWTPVNEPLTTARFSGLYGHWYPHGKDDATFLRTLVNQCKGTALAMREIRRVDPLAQLVTTEDLAFTRSVPMLQYQADFENERRWLSLDLHCGRVTRKHPLWSWLVRSGLTERELLWFAENPCVPDVIGCNYYLTSERWLDDNVAAWPAWSHGRNGRHAYADVHAALTGELAGLERLLGSVWERYRLPIAITEAHLGSTRDEQLRWLVDVHDAALRAKQRGADVRAVTVWSVFGSFDWHCLVTRDDGCYEPGVFDVRGPHPRPTALAQAVRDLAAGRRPAHPVLAGPGFWQRRTSKQEAA